jgi:signal transduction histidine kinase
MVAQNVTNELILEHLKAIQAKLADIASEVHDLKTDVRGVKGHMASFMQSEVSQDAAIATLQERLERIERRLEISQ